MRRTTSRPTGTIMAPPIPCTTRAAVNSAKVLLIPQIIDASVKIAIADENTVRAPSLSATHPLTGMKTASVSI